MRPCMRVCVSRTTHRPTAIRVQRNKGRPRSIVFTATNTTPQTLLRAELGIDDAEYQHLNQVNSQLQHVEETALQNNLGVLKMLRSREHGKKLVMREPELLTTSLTTWLDFLAGYGLRQSDFVRMLQQHPEVMVQGSIHKAGQVLMFLQSHGVRSQEVAGHVLPRWPQLLTCDVQRTMVPVVQCLVGLGCTGPLLRQVVSRNPSFLTCSVEHDIQPKLDYLHSLGFQGEDLHTLLTANVGLLLTQLELTRQRIGFLQAIGIRGADLRTLLLSFPGTLTLALPNLRRKWRFLTTEMHGDVTDILAYPAFFTTGIQQKLGPRFYFVRERKLQHRLVAARPRSTAREGRDGHGRTDGAENHLVAPHHRHTGGDGDDGNGEAQAYAGAKQAQGLQDECEGHDRSDDDEREHGLVIERGRHDGYDEGNEGNGGECRPLAPNTDHGRHAGEGCSSSMAQGESHSHTAGSPADTGYGNGEAYGTGHGRSAGLEPDRVAGPSRKTYGGHSGIGVGMQAKDCRLDLALMLDCDDVEFAARVGCSDAQYMAFKQIWGRYMGAEWKVNPTAQVYELPLSGSW